MHQEHPPLCAGEKELAILLDIRDGCRRGFIAVRAEQLPAVRLGRVGFHIDFGNFAILKEEQHVPAVVLCHRHINGVFALVHSELRGDVFAQYAGLGVPKIGSLCLVHLRPVRKEQKVHIVGALQLLHHLVALFELLLPAHAQRLRRDLLEIPIAGEKQMHGIIGDLLLFPVLLQLVGIEQHRAARLAILLCHRLQFLDDDPLDLCLAVQNPLELRDVLFQLADLFRALEDVFPVEVAQFDLGHIFRLHLVDAEADHQVRDHLGLLFRVAHNGHCLVDVQQDRLKALEQMELVALFAQVKMRAAAHAFDAERHPLLQQVAHAEHARDARDQHVEVAGEAVLQGRKLKQALHQAVRVYAALQVNGDLQPIQARFIADVGNLLELAVLYQIHHFFDNRFHRGCGGNLRDVDAVDGFVVAIPRAHAEAAASGPVNLLDGLCIVNELASAGEVRRQQGGGDVVLRVAHQGNRRLADLRQVKWADGTRHANRDARVGIDQHGREARGQQGGFLQGVVVVVYEIHGVLVNVVEELLAEVVQTGLCVTGGRPRHVPGIKFAKVSLGIDVWVQQRLITPAQAHHGIVDGSVAVGIQLHRLPHDIGRFGAGRAEQAHLIHGVQQLPVRRFEAVDLRDGAGENHAHRIGHVVLFQRAGDPLFHHLARAFNHAVRFGTGLGRVFAFFRHLFPLLSSRPPYRCSGIHSLR